MQNGLTGCIFGEMIMGKIMFKGNDYIDQLQRIFQVMGTPEDVTLTALCSARVLKYLKSWPKHKPADLKLMFPTVEKSGGWPAVVFVDCTCTASSTS
jgi:mitogen-activated protein kinase 7